MFFSNPALEQARARFARKILTNAAESEIEHRPPEANLADVAPRYAEQQAIG
jgi:hypothetical protein